MMFFFFFFVWKATVMILSLLASYPKSALWAKVDNMSAMPLMCDAPSS